MTEASFLADRGTLVTEEYDSFQQLTASCMSLLSPFTQNQSHLAQNCFCCALKAEQLIYNTAFAALQINLL